MRWNTDAWEECFCEGIDGSRRGRVRIADEAVMGNGRMRRIE